jgi:RNA polymerase sigma-70 factor (ECF subfamily)
MSGTVPFMPSVAPATTTDNKVASSIRERLLDGRRAEARELFAEIVGRHQRRASRIAYHYLRDAAEADEAVQDAFVKTFGNLTAFRDELPFEVWFTRILINGCLDRIKARKRRARWLTSIVDLSAADRRNVSRMSAAGTSPEERLLQLERRRALADALDRLPDRQRTVFLLSHYDGCSTRQVSELTGLQESTVRVHLFRAVRKLRALVGPQAAPIPDETKDKVG